MRFSTIIAVALSAVAASAHDGYHNGTTNGTTEITVTEVVTKYTTYCPLPTTIVENNHTYIVTEATTLTISNCPCTLTKTYTTVTSSLCPSGCGATTHVLPTVTPPTYPNATKPTTTTPVGSSNSTTPSTIDTPPIETGSASRATIAAGALAGLIGVAAYLL